MKTLYHHHYGVVRVRVLDGKWYIHTRCIVDETVDDTNQLQIISYNCA
jgi:hypothetical protein